MFSLETFRLIRKTFNRFFTLVMIVLIGVAFMMGLMSSASIMKTSVDLLADAQHLQDVQLFSPYGFCEEDVEALKNNDVVEAVFPSKMTDVYGDFSSYQENVIRVRELYSDVNRYDLTEGRMPLTQRECLALKGSGLQIGDQLSLSLKDEDISSKLKQTRFYVSGLVSSGEFMAKINGTSLLDNKPIDCVIYIQNDLFSSDYYTSVFLTLKGADKPVSFTNDYQSLIQDLSYDLDQTIYSQQDFNKDKIYQEISDQLKEGEQELSDQKKEAEEQFANAKKQLDDANTKIIMSELTIQTNQATLKQSQQVISENEKLLKQSEVQVNEAILEVEKQSGQPFDLLYSELEASYYVYTSLEMQRDDDTLTSIPLELLQQEKIANQEKIKELQLAIENTDQTDEIASYQKEIDSLISRNEIIDSLSQEIRDNISQQELIDSLLKEMDESASGNLKESFIQLKTLKEAKEKLEQGKEELEKGKAECAAGQIALENAVKELNSGKIEYEKGLKEYEESYLDYLDQIEKAEADLAKGYQELEELPDSKWTVLYRDSHYSSYMFENNADQMQAIGFAVPLLFYLVAALVCLTTMTRLIDEQRSQIGIYRALGFTKMQIEGKYLLYAFLASIIGSLFGIFLGMGIFPTVIYKTWRLMYDLPAMHLYFPIRYLLICIGAFTVLMLGVTYRVVELSLKEAPSQLMRPKAPKNAKAIFLEKITFIWNRLSFTSKITSRNLIRYKSRFFMTVLGVAGCTALLVVGFGVKDSISDVVNLQYGKLFTSNYTVMLKDDHEIDQLLQDLKDDLKHDAIVPFMEYTTKIYFDKDDDTAQMYCVDARNSVDSLGLYDAVSREEIRLSNDGVIVSHKFAINHDIKAGDMIVLESSSGIKAEAKVSAICEWYFQHYIFISDAYYSSIFSENVHDDRISVSSLDFSALKNECESYDSLVSITDYSAFIEQFDIMIQALDLIILVIIITAGSLAFVVLINLIQVNISERIREIATLKVLGFREGEVNSYIFKEIMILTLIGASIGLPLGKVEERMIMSVINMDMIMFGTDIKLFSYLFSFAITIIFTLIVFLFTRKQLSDISMVESLKSVE